MLALYRHINQPDKGWEETHSSRQGKQLTHRHRGRSELGTEHRCPKSFSDTIATELVLQALISLRPVNVQWQELWLSFHNVHYRPKHSSSWR